MLSKVSIVEENADSHCVEIYFPRRINNHTKMSILHTLQRINPH